MTMPEHVPSQNASPTPRERALRDSDRVQLPGDTLLEPGSGPLQALGLDRFGEQSFAPSSWLDMPAESTLVDHPLLRGLLLELPPRNSPPTDEWFDRWFEATRSVLGLIYLRR
ncbi:hypothetical protein [Catellatospora citrea]|uniref:Uncharacterized protein n=1 Tax=Catellatospora citrea TaxID=53366 RepID=A0A8J3KLT2_9ACTN|nr:hypothetical protein [Catellatospora citrea]RKE08804.1 hypothetical protein C8E86_3671 [Catellatospora citrea]GIG02428.1 hypothetical protein Cci01nite_75210 [Catellatospora citrea]